MKIYVAPRAVTVATVDLRERPLGCSVSDTLEKVYRLSRAWRNNIAYAYGYDPWEVGRGIRIFWRQVKAS